MSAKKKQFTGMKVIITMLVIGQLNSCALSVKVTKSVNYSSQKEKTVLILKNKNRRHEQTTKSD